MLVHKTEVTQTLLLEVLSESLGETAYMQKEEILVAKIHKE